MGLRIPNSEIAKLLNRFAINKVALSDTAFMMKQLVDDRFRTQGASGGKPWPPKKMKAWGYDDGRAILTGVSAVLRKSFEPFSTDAIAGVGSWDPKSVVHQLGTIGKGGTLKDIVPRRAKALFVPVTDRAINSVRLAGKEAGAVRLLHKIAESAERMIAPYRAGVKESRKNKTTTFVKLRRGRLYKGKLQVWDEKKGEYVDGTPDFIFLHKVSLPPRPMLPESPGELTAIANFFVDSQLNPT